jgi:hypothetical protein
MSRKKSGNSGGRLKKTVFCPECGTMMKYAKSKKDQHRPNVDCSGPELDDFGRPLLVTRRFYVCGKCETVVWFDYRQDGKEGDLHKELEFMRKTGRKFPGLGGTFGEILG